MKILEEESHHYCKYCRKPLESKLEKECQSCQEIVKKFVTQFPTLSLETSQLPILLNQETLEIDRFDIFYDLPQIHLEQTTGDNFSPLYVFGTNLLKNYQWNFKFFVNQYFSTLPAFKDISLIGILETDELFGEYKDELRCTIVIRGKVPSLDLIENNFKVFIDQHFKKTTFIIHSFNSSWTVPVLGTVFTNLSPIDQILDGGLPNNQLTEIIGDTGIPKVDFFYYITAQILQKSDTRVVWVDMVLRFVPSQIHKYFLQQTPEGDVGQLINKIEIYQPADIDGLEQIIQDLSKSPASMDLLVVDGIPMVFSNLKLLGLEMSRSEQRTRFNNIIERLSKIQKKFQMPVLITGWAKTESEIKDSNFFISPPLSKCLYITHDTERVFFIKEVHSNPEIIGHFIVTWEEIISIGVTKRNTPEMEIV